MLIHVMGKRWRLRFVPSLAARGECDPPHTKGKSIRILDKLTGEERLEVLLHEVLHAAGWPLDEAFVAGFAADAARVLWQLGYRECPSTSPRGDGSSPRLAGRGPATPR